MATGFCKEDGAVQRRHTLRTLRGSRAARPFRAAAPWTMASGWCPRSIGPGAGSSGVARSVLCFALVMVSRPRLAWVDATMANASDVHESMRNHNFASVLNHPEVCSQRTRVLSAACRVYSLQGHSSSTCLQPPIRQSIGYKNAEGQGRSCPWRQMCLAVN